MKGLEYCKRDLKKLWEQSSCLGIEKILQKTYVSIMKQFHKLGNAMFVKRKVSYSALFTNLFRWRSGAVSFPQVTSFWPS